MTPVNEGAELPKRRRDQFNSQRILRVSAISSLLSLASGSALLYCYKPAQYADYAIFIALTTIVSGLYGLRADLDVLKSRRRSALYWLNTVIFPSRSRIFVLVAMTVVFAWQFPNLILVTTAAYLLAANNVLMALGFRLSSLRLVRRVRIYTPAMALAFQLVFASIHDRMGLIDGYVFAAFITFLVSLGIYIRIRRISRAQSRLQHFNFDRVLVTAQGLFDYFVVVVTLYAVKIRFSPTDAGVYSLVSKVMGMPGVVVSTSLGNYLLRKRRGDFQDPKFRKKLFLFSCLTVIVFILTVLAIWGVKPLLPTKWEEIPDIWSALSFQFLAVTLLAPFVNIAYALKMARGFFFFGVAYGLAMLVPFLMLNTDLSFQSVSIVSSMTSGTVLMICLVWLWRGINEPNR